MDAKRWGQLQPILDEVLDLAGDERRRRLDQVCAGDPDLRAQVEALLNADAETGALDEPTGALLEDALRAAAAPLAPALVDALLPGTRVADRYRIVSLLGRGGMGEVYRADDLKLGQSVALKFLPVHLQHRPDYLERLLEETKLARQVSHPNVCRVYDIGEWRGRHFLTMEYIDGEDLASLGTRIGRLPSEKALDVARQLCAGLDAAHQLGILHRDLKPSNVMLDGRGRIRVTDFGLAVTASGLSDPGTRAGTPAYMAPEQLEGERATVRSDVYALGLVLYELFTGRRAHVDGARRDPTREDASPTRPSQLVDEIDSVVERAILRCLEKDPTLRPASARNVALMLPGGDPIAAALAVGDTPSPDLIAASGPDGVLQPAIAVGVLSVTLTMLVVLVLLVDRASILGWVSWPRSVAALEDNARGILDRIGYRASRIDSAHLVTSNWSWAAHVMRTDASTDRWAPLREAGQPVMWFFHRQAPRPLIPGGPFGVVTTGDPGPEPDDARVATDLRGRLVWLEIRPPDVAPASVAAADPDWAVLFRQAGLDPSLFMPTAPTRNPPISADMHAAWNGVLPDFARSPVRVEAAAYRGQPVFFELVMPWDSYWMPAETKPPMPPDYVLRWSWLAVMWLSAVTMITLAIRHWLSARGDRSGAFRLAVFVFGCRFLVWIVGSHHVLLPQAEWVQALNALGGALIDASASWAFYMALEPYGRRLHPRLLVSWTRLLRGRLRDPLVGRDMLYGTAASTLLILCWGELYVILPHVVGLSSPPPPVPNPLGSAPFLPFLRGGPLNALLGGRHVPEALLAAATRTFGTALIWFMVLLGLSLLLRKRALIIVVMLGLGTVLPWPASLSDYQPIGLACSLAGTAVMLWTVRVGLIGALSLVFCLHVWMAFPVTSNISAPHFGIGLVGVLAIAALATYGALIASRAGFSGRVAPVRR